ncbi:MAG: peptidylprolyl isomerase [bacterium]|nr:peptidylprolyl isomerase [bacterium]
MLAAISCEASSAPKGPSGVKAIQEFIAGAPIDKSAKDWKQRLPTPPKVPFDDRKTYYWLLETTVGSLKVKLLHDEAPMHASSTIYLTELGFYDDVKFHRVIPGFMAQGGDPTGSGRGGPGYNYAGELGGSSKHDGPGVLSMANAGPNTDGSQFFLTFKATPHLNGKHTIFGKVVEGMGTLAELEKNGSGGRGAPKIDLRIEKATILVE